MFLLLYDDLAREETIGFFYNFSFELSMPSEFRLLDLWSKYASITSETAHLLICGSELIFDFFRHTTFDQKP